MKRRTHILAEFRRRRNGLGRFLLAAFAAATFTIGASPCVAMAGAVEAPHAKQPTSDDARGESHDGSHASHHASHETHAAHASAASAAHAAHDHMHAHSDHDSATSTGTTHCPHCPLSAAMPGHAPSSGHAFCAASDDGADHASPSASPLFLKHLAWPIAFEHPPSVAAHSPPISPLPPPALARGAVPLNLRHCVFLI